MFKVIIKPERTEVFTCGFTRFREVIWVSFCSIPVHSRRCNRRTTVVTELICSALCSLMMSASLTPKTLRNSQRLESKCVTSNGMQTDGRTAFNSYNIDYSIQPLQ